MSLFLKWLTNIKSACFSYKSDLQNYYDLDFIGTPLVTYLREGIHTGADIQDVVDTLLKPLLQRKHSLASDQVNPREENGTFLAIEADEVLENCNPYSGPHGHSNSNVEPETISNGRPSFQLWLYSSHTRSCYLLKNDTLIESGGVIRVLLEWRDKEYGLYNISFLKNPPVVFESELVKWEKQWEEVSLFSCLEAFLKEEPLGLEDTWLVTNLHLQCSHFHCLVHSYVCSLPHHLISHHLFLFFFFFYNLGTVLLVINRGKQPRS